MYVYTDTISFLNAHYCNISTLFQSFGSNIWHSVSCLNECGPRSRRSRIRVQCFDVPTIASWYLLSGSVHHVLQHHFSEYVYYVLTWTACKKLRRSLSCEAASLHAVPIHWICIHIYIYVYIYTIRGVGDIIHGLVHPSVASKSHLLAFWSKWMVPVSKDEYIKALWIWLSGTYPLLRWWQRVSDAEVGHQTSHGCSRLSAWRWY